MRALLVVALLAAAGCGSDPKPTAPAPVPQKMPPEVEYDPVTAAEKYKAAKKNSRP